MKCYKCNSVLTDSDYCMKCGADVSVYKVVVKASNAYYNIGLEKARVRDLSGAAIALRTSVKINKSNIKARNLLGLVYFEMGEVAEALKEWVISLNQKPDKNVATVYIRKVKSNPNRLEALNQAAKKYNFALEKLHQGGDDVALIQLKKVVSENPRFVRALLLLSLLYMKRGEMERSAKTLQRVLKIDRNNTLALRYQDELHQLGNAAMDMKEDSYFRGKHRKLENLTGHDVIAPRNTYKEPSSGILTVLTLLLGVVIGVALVWFLVLPARLERAQNDNNVIIKDYSEKLSAYSIDIAQLKDQVTDLTAKLETAENELNAYTGSSGTIAMYTKLIAAADAYVAGNYEDAGALLIEVNITKLPTNEAKSLYSAMEEACNNGAQSYYKAGVNAYNRGDYVTALEYLKVSYEYDNTTVEISYYLAMSYLQLSNDKDAQPYVERVLNDFAGTNFANQLNQFLTNRANKEDQ